VSDRPSISSNVVAVVVSVVSTYADGISSPNSVIRPIATKLMSAVTVCPVSV
jgi:hypothetical protein